MEEIDQKINERFWNERAQIASDPRSVSLDNESVVYVERSIRRQHRWLLDRLEAHGCRFDDSADLACGAGDWTVMLARRARRLFVVDLAKSFVDATRARIEGIDSCEASYVVGNLVTAKLPTNLDFVMFGAAIQYISDADIPGLLESIRESLRPDGLFYLRTTVSQRDYRQANCTDTYQAIYRPESWYTDAIRAAGFDIVERGDLTDLIADVVTWEWLGERRARSIGKPLTWMIRSVRRMYRRPRRTGNRAWILRPRVPQ